jgi:hypothetical protein
VEQLGEERREREKGRKREVKRREVRTKVRWERVKGVEKEGEGGGGLLGR